MATEMNGVMASNGSGGMANGITDGMVGGMAGG